MFFNSRITFDSLPPAPDAATAKPPPLQPIIVQNPNHAASIDIFNFVQAQHRHMSFDKVIIHAHIANYPALGLAQSELL